jgi:DNA-directed RNA polymerase specialized sigma24 family protein
MNYLIHNLESVFSDKEQERTRIRVKEHIQRIGQVINNHSRPVVMDFYFSWEDKTSFMVSSIINLNGDIIYIREKGHEIESCLESLFNRIKLTIVKKNYRKRKATSLELKEQKLSGFKEYMPDLQEMKKNRDQDIFNRMLNNLLKELADYIKRRIKAAEMTTAIKRRKYKVQELLDELYLMIYERIEDMPDEAEDMNNWLYHLADELLLKLFREVEFEKTHFNDLEKIVESEYRLLEEKYTVDAEEEIIPIEELDEYDRISDWYSADDLIFGDDESSLLDEITLRLNQKEIHLLIEKELAKLPLNKRTIMDQYLINQMSVEEIAEMKGITPLEVDSVIKEVNKDLVKKLSLLI